MAYIGNQPAANFAGNVFINQFSGDGVTTQFALNDIPISVEHVDLFIGGVYQNKNTYSIVGNVLTCSEAPVVGVGNIEVKIFEVLPIGVAGGIDDFGAVSGTHKQIQIRRGSSSETAAFTGAAGELTYNTDTKSIVAHDGITPGGSALVPTKIKTPSGGSITISAADTASNLTHTLLADGDPLGASKVGLSLYAAGVIPSTTEDGIRKRFILADDFISTTNTALQNNAGWVALINHVKTLPNGAHVQVSRGTYLFSAQCELTKKMLVVGEGQMSTIFSFSHTGNGFSSVWPINSSTAVWIGLRDIGVICTNPLNNGAGFVDVGGTFVTLTDCYIGGVNNHKGFAFSVIMDQTELAQIERCDLNLPSVGCVWLVNGTDYSGGDRNYTNRITIRDCQLGALPGVSSYGIVDDGGASHSFTDNNYYGFINQIKVAEAYCLKIDGGEFESSTGTPIVFSNTRYNGGAAFQSAVSPSITNAFIVAPSGFGCIGFAGAGQPSAVNPYIASCNLANPNNAAAITGLANITSVKLVANTLANQPVIDVQPMGDLVNLSLDTNYFTFLKLKSRATAGTTSEKLDAFDQGTWTPTYVPSAGSFGSITYDSVTGGKYTRIGNMVYVQAAIRTTAITLGAASGVVNLGGLPYVSSANSSGKLDAYFTLQIGFSAAFTTNFPSSALGTNGASSVELLYRATANGASANLPVSSLALGSSSNFMVISGCYECA